MGHLRACVFSFVMTLSVVLGIGFLALPVSLVHSGMEPFIFTFSINLVIQVFILFSAFHVVQTGMVLSRMKEGVSGKLSIVCDRDTAGAIDVHVGCGDVAEDESIRGRRDVSDDDDNISCNNGSNSNSSSNNDNGGNENRNVNDDNNNNTSNYGSDNEGIDMVVIGSPRGALVRAERDGGSNSLLLRNVSNVSNDTDSVNDIVFSGVSNNNINNRNNLDNNNNNRNDNANVEDVDIVDSVGEDMTRTDLKSLSRLFLPRWAAILFEISVLLHLIALLISYTIASTHALGSIFNISRDKTWIISPFYSLFFTFVVISLDRLLSSIMTAMTVFKGSLLVLLVSLVGYLAYALGGERGENGEYHSSNYTPEDNWGRVYEPLVLGTLAIGGSINCLPLLFRELEREERKMQFKRGGNIAVHSHSGNDSHNIMSNSIDVHDNINNDALLVEGEAKEEANGEANGEANEEEEEVIDTGPAVGAGDCIAVSSTSVVVGARTSSVDESVSLSPSVELSVPKPAVSARGVKLIFISSSMGLIVAFTIVLLFSSFVLRAIPPETLADSTVSTFPIREKIYQSGNGNLKWGGAVIDAFVVVSLAVSFVAVGVSTKNVLEGFARDAAESYKEKIDGDNLNNINRTISNSNDDDDGTRDAFVASGGEDRIHSVRKSYNRYRLIVLIATFSLVAAVAWANPGSFMAVIDTAATATLNLEVGVFLTMMLARSVNLHSVASIIRNFSSTGDNNANDVNYHAIALYISKGVTLNAGKKAVRTSIAISTFLSCVVAYTIISFISRNAK